MKKNFFLKSIADNLIQIVLSSICNGAIFITGLADLPTNPFQNGLLPAYINWGLIWLCIIPNYLIAHQILGLRDRHPLRIRNKASNPNFRNDYGKVSGFIRGINNLFQDWVGKLLLGVGLTIVFFWLTAFIFFKSL